MARRTVLVPVYLQVEPKRRSGYGDHEVWEASVIAATTKKPKRPRAGATDVLIVKVTLQIPSAAFDPLEPEAIIAIPEHLVDRAPIEVVAEDPREDDA
jgi:hypothetical protein